MRREKIKNKYDKKLSLIIEAPKERIKDFIIISHCFTCSKSYKLYNNISKYLVEKGYGVVRYDAMGLGNSEGDFSSSSFSTNVEDLICVYDYIAGEYKEAKYLFGHSIGSLVSIKAASSLDSIRGIATVGSPSSFDNLDKLFSNYEEDLRENKTKEIKLAGRNIKLGLRYLEDLRNTDIKEVIKAFKKPIIIFQSDSDRTVPYSDGLNLFNLIGGDKSFITLKNVDHLAGDERDSKYIGEILCSWLENL